MVGQQPPRRLRCAQDCPVILDQADIDALLASATQIASDTESDAGPAPRAQATATAPQSARSGGRKGIRLSRGELSRVLQMRFPVIVVLAERQMELVEILNLNVGSIIEFERSSDAELALRVGNRPVATGQAVKVGEFFGLRVTAIDSIEERIRAMGGS
jgi:flagellar motor switch protein FliN/FliY